MFVLWFSQGLYCSKEERICNVPPRFPCYNCILGLAATDFTQERMERSTLCIRLPAVIVDHSIYKNPPGSLGATLSTGLHALLMVFVCANGRQERRGFFLPRLFPLLIEKIGSIELTVITWEANFFSNLLRLLMLSYALLISRAQGRSSMAHQIYRGVRSKGFHQGFPNHWFLEKKYSWGAERFGRVL